jgi:hypothetical protein
MPTRYVVTTNAPTPGRARAHGVRSPLRRDGLLCVTGAVISSVGAVVTAAIHTSVSSGRESFPWTPGVSQLLQTLWAIASLLVLVGVIGLARSGLVGVSKLGRIGIRSALVAMTLLVPCELSFVFVAHSATHSTASSTLGATIGVVAALCGIGFAITGVATLRERSWTGWGRYTPLLCGVFVLVVLIPVQAIRPSIFAWPIAGWNVCLALLGSALAGEGTRGERTTISA